MQGHLAPAARAGGWGCPSRGASVPGCGHHVALPPPAGHARARRRGLVCRAEGGAGFDLGDVKLTNLVGKMAAQTVQGGGLGLGASSVESMTGFVSFYKAMIELGGMTCRLMLKEYPEDMRAVGDNEMRAYAMLLGGEEAELYPFERLRQAALYEREGYKAGGPAAAHAPVLHGAFFAQLAGEGGPQPRLQAPPGAQLGAAVDVGPGSSLWLGFRFSEHGATTLLEYAAATLERRSERAEVAARRASGGQIGADLTAKSVLSILLPFERVKEDPQEEWARFARALAYRAVASLAFVHSRGVVHGSLSAASLLLSSLEEGEWEGLTVRLYNFGFAWGEGDGEGGAIDPPPEVARVGRAAGAATEEQLNEWGRREDVKALGAALTHLFFPSAWAAGTDVTRLIVDVFDYDMVQVEEYFSEEEPWACNLLGARGGEGWAFLRGLLAGEASAQQMLRAPFFF